VKHEATDLEPVPVGRLGTRADEARGQAGNAAGSACGQAGHSRPLQIAGARLRGMPQEALRDTSHFRRSPPIEARTRWYSPLMRLPLMSTTILSGDCSLTLNEPRSQISTFPAP
jgi:hypothetical protein